MGGGYGVPFVVVPEEELVVNRDPCALDLGEKPHSHVDLGCCMPSAVVTVAIPIHALVAY